MKDMKERFEKLLERGELVAAQKLKEHLRGVTAQDWPSDDLEEMVKGWRTDIRTLVGAWPELDSKDRFAVLQQVSSVLRTALAYDVEGRLR